MKPKKDAVSLIISDEEGNFLVVKRANDPKDELAGGWGFPAVTLKDGETEQEGAARVGRQKLGIEIELGEKIGDSTHDRTDYVLHMTDYKATVKSGTPKAPQADKSVSQYDECKFINDPIILFPSARKGSQCTQLFLESIGADWKE